MSAGGLSFKADVSLRRLSDGLGTAERGELRSLMEAAGASAAETAKQLAPVKTGRLRDSIGCTVTASPDGSLEAAVGSDVPYAAAQELGTARIAGKHFLENGLTAGAAAVFGQKR